MPIYAEDKSEKRELIPVGNYVARCYQQIEIGTVIENFQGKPTTQRKIRVGWELPEETRDFGGEQKPLVISKEYTLSMNEKSNLRKDLKAWRGKDFTEEEARKFDVTKLIGAACMLNIIHKTSNTDPSKVYEQIAGITPLPKSLKCPPAVNPPFVLSYDQFDSTLFNSLPDFIKDKMKTSAEYSIVSNGYNDNHVDATPVEVEDDLPF